MKVQRTQFWFQGLCVAGLCAAAILAGGSVAGAAPPQVSVDETDAFIDTFQALNATDERSRDKSGNDWAAFGENLHPAVLTGPEGKADAFVQLAATVVTSSQAIPFNGVRGIGASGRLLDEARKTNNSAPGIPVASSEGEMSVEFEVNDPTRTQFAGALLAGNNDENDCTEILVELSGPISRTYEADAGGDCSQGIPRSKGFVIEQVFPVGSYTLDVEYGATVDPEDPGTRRANASVDVSVGFLPPDTKITRTRIIAPRIKARGNAGGGKATFAFKATKARAKRLQCGLAKAGKDVKFKRCSSPKTFKNLDRGRYVFAARAVGPVGPDATPAEKRFKIG